MATNHVRIGETLVFSAGSGEWFNQPGDYRWDMGEDVEPRPLSPWHVELRRAIDAETTAAQLVVVDVTRMDWLVGLDWGFLITLSKQLSTGGTRLSVVGAERVVQCARIIKTSEFFDVCGSVDEATRKS